MTVIEKVWFRTLPVFYLDKVYFRTVSYLEKVYFRKLFYLEKV